MLIKVYGDGTDITIDRESTYLFPQYFVPRESVNLVWNFRLGFVSNVTYGDRGTQGAQAPG